MLQFVSNIKVLFFNVEGYNVINIYNIVNKFSCFVFIKIGVSLCT